jgi:catechol 2,3-dioxygenase-like lactoylglutathione lyase family enzyme
MKILRVESVVYGVEDMEQGVRFFQDWGLIKSAGTSFSLPSGQTVELKPAADTSIPAAPEKGSTVREVVWGVDGDGSLEELRKDLGRDREVRVDADGALHTRDDMGFGIGFRKSAAAPSSVTAKAERMNKPFDPPRSASPTRIGHVVYNIPKAGQEKAAEFYMKRLQFRMTDHTGDLGDFLRCNGSHDHHNLFFLTLPNHASFNHVAFEVRDFDEIIFGGKNMRQKGWTPFSPPGRHILGSNLFWYFDNPCGGKVEYFADMDVMDDEFKTRHWEKSPGIAMWQLEMNDTPAQTAGPGGPPR